MQLAASFSDAVEQWLSFREAEGLSLGSTLKYRGVLHKLVEASPEWPDYPALVRFVAAQRVGRVTMGHRIAIYKSFFAWATKMAYIERDPAAELTKPKRPKKLPEVLGDEDIELLLNGWRPDYAKADSALIDRDRALVQAYLLTGLRRAELCHLDVGDVDLGPRPAVRVRAGKGERDRVVPLPPRLVLTLRPLVLGREAKEPLFRGRRGNRLDPDAVSYIFIRKVAPAVGKRVTPHMLRHSYATYLSRRRRPLREIQELLGHTSLATTQIYLHVSADDLQEAAQVLEQMGDRGAA